MYFTFEHEHLKAKDRTPNTADWQGRHDTAVAFPRDWESPIMGLIGAWERYAKLHKQAYEAPIGEDGFVGEAWKDIGTSIRALLNGQTGRLDCGTLSTAISKCMADNGVEVDE